MYVRFIPNEDNFMLCDVHSKGPFNIVLVGITHYTQVGRGIGGSSGGPTPLEWLRPRWKKRKK